MQHLKVLVVTNGPSIDELSRLKGGLVFIAGKVGVDIMDHVVFEDIVAFQLSHQLRDRAKEYGYVIMVGREAYTKTQSQVANSSLNVCKTPGLSSWGGTNKRVIASQIAELFREWDKFAVEKKLLVTPMSQESKEEASEDRAAWIEANLLDFERYLEMQLNASRYQACIFKLSNEAAPYMEVVDATRKLRVPISDVVPVLAKPEVLSDKDETEKVVDKLKKNGYQNPFLLEIRDFLVLVRICCQLAKSGRARLEIALEPEGQDADTP